MIGHFIVYLHSLYRKDPFSSPFNCSPFSPPILNACLVAGLLRPSRPIAAMFSPRLTIAESGGFDLQDRVTKLLEFKERLRETLTHMCRKTTPVTPNPRGPGSIQPWRGFSMFKENYPSPDLLHRIEPLHVPTNMRHKSTSSFK